MPNEKDKFKETEKASMAVKADRYKLYESSVQCAETEVDFIESEFKKLRGRRPALLREDFCGTAAVCFEWASRRQENTAIGVDIDGEVLNWANENHLPALKASARSNVKLIRGDVLKVSTPLQDIILAMNFSYWLFKERKLLLGYFRKVRKNLDLDGIFFLDCFGGSDAYRELKERTKLDGFTYVWDQAAYNPVNSDISCHIHFHFPDKSKLKRAFTYDWRLWTLPEIRELLLDAGFSEVIIYAQAVDPITEEPSQMEPVLNMDADLGWIAYIGALN
ncbi:class I SAM-dependent methyltransferase [Gammaproteobacteria bacterium]|nr:class I SAM-dependent methyltransferase [Gammaproteobacteria bacterium]MDC3202902.1 class I SAM-dependent methyltransferase [Gammaproteobacteria bacterium]